MKPKTAIILGATGLTGSILVKLLVQNSNYDKIVVLSRRDIKFNSPKIEVIHVDFQTLEKTVLPAADDVFSCIGSTLRKSGSIENFRKSDVDIPLTLSKITKAQGAKAFLSISSIGTNAKTKNYYLKAKHDMETGVLACGFEKTALLRPSMILGKREEFRFAELVERLFFKPLTQLLSGKMRKYRPISAEAIARAMVEIANGDFVNSIFESDEIQAIADKFAQK